MSHPINQSISITKRSNHGIPNWKLQHKWKRSLHLFYLFDSSWLAHSSSTTTTSNATATLFFKGPSQGEQQYIEFQMGLHDQNEKKKFFHREKVNWSMFLGYKVYLFPTLYIGQFQFLSFAITWMVQFFFKVKSNMTNVHC